MRSRYHHLQLNASGGNKYIRIPMEALSIARHPVCRSHRACLKPPVTCQPVVQWSNVGPLSFPSAVNPQLPDWGYLLRRPGTSSREPVHHEAAVEHYRRPAVRPLCLCRPQMLIVNASFHQRMIRTKVVPRGPATERARYAQGSSAPHGVTLPRVVRSHSRVA